jgi:hypothetical protein
MHPSPVTDLKTFLPTKDPELRTVRRTQVRDGRRLKCYDFNGGGES